MTSKIILMAAALALPAGAAREHSDAAARSAWVQSISGSNAWNMGRAPVDWHAEIARYHGHVGPWNVLGWRIGQAALREFKTEWGKHELEIVCYVPPQTPFTCMLDGLSVGTGNSSGRLDLRMAEVLAYQQSFVAVRRKDGSGGVVEFHPHTAYLKAILNQPPERLEMLCKECAQLPEEKLFTIRRVAS